MITCPWCGTNYTAFQSNCKNCGGPLAPLPRQAEQLSDDDLLPPPPAPRPVPQSYTWKLIFTDGAGIAGFVLALLGFIFFGVGGGLAALLITAFVGVPFLILGMVLFVAGAILLVARYQTLGKRVLVLQVGEAARGQVVGVEQNDDVRVNGRHPWKIAYRFSSPRGEYTGELSTLNTPGPQLQPGREVYVLFLPDAPEVNTMYPHP